MIKKLATAMVASAAILTGAGMGVLPASAGVSEVSTVAGCVAAGEPTSIVACAAGGFVINEAQKCIASGGKDCIGPHNELRKVVENNVVGPVKDVVSGQIGNSKASLWRKAGLPRIRLW